MAQLLHHKRDMREPIANGWVTMHLAPIMVYLCLKPKNRTGGVCCQSLGNRGFRPWEAQQIVTQTHTHTQTVTALYMTHILDMAIKRKEVAGIALGQFRLIKLLAGANRVMTKPPWSSLYQRFSESYPWRKQSTKLRWLPVFYFPHAANAHFHNCLKSGRELVCPFDENFVDALFEIILTLDCVNCLWSHYNS